MGTISCFTYSSYDWSDELQPPVIQDFIKVYILVNPTRFLPDCPKTKKIKVEKATTGNMEDMTECHEILRSINVILMYI